MHIELVSWVICAGVSMVHAIPTPPVSSTSFLQRQLVHEHNVLRDAHDLRPIAWSDRLASIAQAHASSCPRYNVNPNFVDGLFATVDQVAPCSSNAWEHDDDDDGFTNCSGPAWTWYTTGASHWDYTSQLCLEDTTKCRSFTNMLSPSVRSVGCGWSSCSAADSAKLSLVWCVYDGAQAFPVIPPRSLALNDLMQRLPVPPPPSPLCPPRIRRSWEATPTKDQDLFVQAVALAMDRGFHQLFVDIHAETLGEAHDSCVFLLWHRKFILGYENMLRSLGRRFACVTLPYFDYIQHNLNYLHGKCTSLESCSPFLTGLGGSTSGHLSSQPLAGFAFSHFKCVDAFPASHACAVPGSDCMRCIPRGAWTRTYFNSTALSFTSIKRVLFDADDGMTALSLRIERSPHDVFHFTLSAALANFVVAALDPVFYGHHATIDILAAIHHRCRVRPLKLTKEQAKLHPGNFQGCVINNTMVVKATSPVGLRLPVDGVPTSVDEYAVTRPWFQHVPLTYGDIVDTTNLGVHSYRYNLTGLLGTLYSHCDHAGMNHTANMELQANLQDYEDDDQHVVMDVTDVDSLTFLAWRYDVLVQARAQGLDDADADDEMDKMVVMVYEHCLPGTHSEYPEDFKAMWKIQGGEPSKAMLDGVLSGATPIRIQGWAGLNQRYFGCTGERIDNSIKTSRV